VGVELMPEKRMWELVEDVDPEKPFEFLFGHGNLLPAFEAELLGLEAGDNFQFMLKSDEAYGSYDDQLIYAYDHDLFLDKNGLLMEEIAVDNFIPMLDESGEKTITGKVLEVTDDKVVMDYNHPLADMDLYFKGTVVRVRAASPAELERGDVEVHEHTIWDQAADGEDPACNANDYL